MTSAIADAASGELNAAFRKIGHCLDQVTQEQLWWRPAEEMNAIGNLLLHLDGNLRQWIVAGVGGAEDVRRRWEEFAERGPIPKAELARRLEATVLEARRVLENLSADTLCRSRTVQGFEVTGAQAIFDSIAHFRGHTQEIVHMTRCLLGDAYQFDFVPQSRAQGQLD